MNHYDIPAHNKCMITGYFGSIRSQIRTTIFTTVEVSVERNYNRVCHLTIWSLVGMNLIITAAEKEIKGPKASSGAQQPDIKGFMDDVIIMTPTHVQAKWVLT